MSYPRRNHSTLRYSTIDSSDTSLAEFDKKEHLFYLPFGKQLNSLRHHTPHPTSLLRTTHTSSGINHLTWIKGRSMSRSKQRKLESAVAAIQRQHGSRSIRKGSSVSKKLLPQSVGTSFRQLDELMGCKGIPQGHISLFTGALGSGKLTVAYKVLMSAQNPRGRKRKAAASVAIVSLNGQIHVDYLHRCQVDVDDVDIYQPTIDQVVELLLYLVAGNQYKVILVDSLSDLVAVPRQARALQRNLSKLIRLLRTTSSALLFIGEQTAPWVSRFLGLDDFASVRRASVVHVNFTIHQWLHRHDQWHGYRRIAVLKKSRWGTPGRQATLDIEFNGVVKARAPM